MSVGLAGVLPAAVRDQEDDIDEQPYLWSDLLARRNALSLQVEDLVPVLRVDLRKYRSRETGALEVGHADVLATPAVLGDLDPQPRGRHHREHVGVGPPAERQNVAGWRRQ